METIIINKQYEKNAELGNYNKKVLCYNTKQEVLVYKKDDHGISIPTIEAPGHEEKIVSIALEEECLEPLLRVVNCKLKYTTRNNKLVKQYLKYIREYYTCLVEFNNAFKEQLEPLHIEDKIYIPMIMDMEEVISYMNQIYSFQNGTQKALETLYCKVKEKEYERTN